MKIVFDELEPRWRKVNENTIAIDIGDSLRITDMGLMYALRWVPMPIKKAGAGFSWSGEENKDGKRWGLVRVDWKSEPPEIFRGAM